MEQAERQTVSPTIHWPCIQDIGFIPCQLRATEMGDEDQNCCSPILLILVAANHLGARVKSRDVRVQDPTL
jgi:hypothetical protein